MKYLILTCIALVSITSSCAQVSLTEANVALDDSLQIALVQLPANTNLKGRIAFQLKNQNYELAINSSAPLTQTTHVLKKGKQTAYTAYVTTLPLFQIEAPNGIVNEPKRMTTITYSHADTSFTAFAGVELRGSSSIAFPKKTYDLNFYKDSLGSKNLDLQLAGMRNDDDWILDGLYNEPLRMRSKLALELWNSIYSPYYLDKEPKAKAGVSTQYAEVFVNGRYKGLFLLMEQVDRKLLKLKKNDGDTIRGELFQGARYLGASSFDSIPKKKNYLASWGGYDIKYPVPTNAYWDNLYPFTDFVINSSDAEFADAIDQRFYIPNAIDYFLFVNALRAKDNLGKNLYLVRYDEEAPYFYAPWDLDGTLGTIYSGKRIPTTDDFLDNGLLRRLMLVNPADFIGQFQQRWIALRNNQLSETEMLAKQAALYDELKTNLVYEREKRANPSLNEDREGLDYMQSWTQNRLRFLDDYISNLSTKD